LESGKTGEGGEQVREVSQGGRTYRCGGTRTVENVSGNIRREKTNQRKTAVESVLSRDRGRKEGR